MSVNLTFNTPQTCCENLVQIIVQLKRKLKQLKVSLKTCLY